MQIGYAQVIITPALVPPIYMAGFAHHRIAQSVHDDLFARALALQDDGGKCVVLVAVDVIGLFRKDVSDVIAQVQADERFQNEGNPAPQIIISAVHPHHGPDTMGLWGPNTRTSGISLDYLHTLKKAIISVILNAMDSLQPVSSLRVVSVNVPGLAKNARDAHVLDEELLVLQFLDPDQQVAASLFNFACHPEVLAPDNVHITADFPGCLIRVVEAQTGAPCLFFSADLGGMMTPDVTDHSFAEAEALGSALAAAGLQAITNIPPITDLPLALHTKRISVKLTNPLFKIAMKRGLFPDLRDTRGHLHSEVNLLQIGPLWLVTVPGELFPKLGLALKDRLCQVGAKWAGVIGLANDELGYILPEEDFRYPLNPFRPGNHYEETNSVGKAIGPAVMTAIEELLHEHAANMKAKQP
jgi:hypothetical protein